MACFLFPAAEAIIVTAVAYGLRKNEEKKESLVKSAGADVSEAVEEVKVAMSRKLMWLANLLWGGCFLLCFEHIWHGEVVPWFPFLTAATDPEEAAVMLAEIRSVGGSMALLLTAVWAVMLIAVSAIARRKAPQSEKA